MESIPVLATGLVALEPYMRLHWAPAFSRRAPRGRGSSPGLHRCRGMMRCTVFARRFCFEVLTDIPFFVLRPASRYHRRCHRESPVYMRLYERAPLWGMVGLAVGLKGVP